MRLNWSLRLGKSSRRSHTRPAFPPCWLPPKIGGPVYRKYEIYEVLPDGCSQKVNVVTGLEFAKLALQGLAKRTSNECFAADAKTRQIVMQRNVPRPKWRTMKHIFHIAYDEERGFRRAELLRARGYGVLSAIGNDAAEIALSTIHDVDLFIVGQAAPQETRREMVNWLKARFPGVKILAINPPGQQVFGADFNVRENDPERWLQVVTQRLGNTTIDLAGRHSAS